MTWDCFKLEGGGTAQRDEFARLAFTFQAEEGRQAHMCCKMSLISLVHTRMLMKDTIVVTKACGQGPSSVKSASVWQHQCHMLP